VEQSGGGNNEKAERDNGRAAQTDVELIGFEK
jgi:hypothetical protein